VQLSGTVEDEDVDLPLGIPLNYFIIFHSIQLYVYLEAFSRSSRCSANSSTFKYSKTIMIWLQYQLFGQTFLSA